ncbi:hypothetical protein Hanom_Chr11g00974161 [Helianthus anomalus]
MALQTIGDLFFLICYIPGFYTDKGLLTHLHMNSLNIIVDFSNLHVFQGIKDLARYVMFSRCIWVPRSSRFRECDFFLDESQFLNCVFIMLMFVSSKTMLCYHVVVSKTMLWPRLGLGGRGSCLVGLGSQSGRLGKLSSGTRESVWEAGKNWLVGLGRAVWEAGRLVGLGRAVWEAGRLVGLGELFDCLLDTMDSSGTGDSDTAGPRPIVSDDLVSSEREIHTSDVTSTDEDDFQPFALPDAVDEPANGPLVGDLPLVEIPAPIPLAVYPAYDMLLDADDDDDVDFFDDEPQEDDVEGEALIADG